MKKLIKIIILIILLSQISLSQEYSKNKKHYYFADLRLQTGTFLKNSTLLRNIMDKPYFSYNFRVGVQYYGDKLWQKLYAYPKVGLGFWNVKLAGNELGNPMAFYVFFNAPVFRIKRFSLNWELAGGLSFNFLPYNAQTNPRNDIIGTYINVYFDASIEANYKFSERIDISFGTDLEHNSNGALRFPNMGLNMVGLYLSGRYFFNTPKQGKGFALRPEFLKYETPKYNNNNHIDIIYSIGCKRFELQNNKNEYSETLYFASSLNFDYFYAYQHLLGMGFGFGLYYDSSIRQRINKTNPNFIDLSYATIHLGHYINAGKFTLLFQFGTHLPTVKRDLKGPLFLRPSLIYHINKKLFVRVALKTTNGIPADFIECGFGYTIFN